MSQTEVQLIKADAVQTADIANSAVTDAKISALTSSKLTGALPAISGASLTNLPASGKAKNLIINGAMKIAQRGTSSTSEGYQTVDRFRGDFGGTDENPTFAQVDVASGTTPYTLGFRKALRITNGNQTSGAGTGDFIMLRYKAEAQDIANSGWNYVSSSSNITLSFWIKSSVAQNFYGYLETSDGTAYLYPFETGSLTADTWTKVTKTIPGNSNLTFNNDNGQGLILVFNAFRGTDTTGSVSLNAWGAYNSSIRVPNMTSTWYTTNDATFEVTGIQLEVGSQATPFEHLTMGEELTLCHRYYYKLGKLDYLGTHMSANEVYGIGMSDNDDVNIYGIINFPVMMRQPPTSIDQSGSASDYRVRRDTNKTCSGVPTFVNAAEHFCRVNFPSSSHGWGTGQMLWCMSAGSSGYLGFGAEL